MSNKSDDLYSNSERFYQSCLFSSAYNLYKIDCCAVRDYVWRYFSLLREAGDRGDFSVPSDFDPVGYMLLNPDIVYAGVNPYSHYIEYGCLEGRQYSINLPQYTSIVTPEDSLADSSDSSIDECSWEATDDLGKKARRIVFHIGGGKTGSSALQNFLDVNFKLLEKYGFSYENRLNISSIYEITSGNGHFLFDLLKNDVVTDEQLDHAILSYLGHSKNGICSSEFLSLLNEREWNLIQQSCDRLDINYKIIIYIRNLIPYIYSSYSQAVKRGGEDRSIYEFSLSVTWQHLDTLRILHNSIEADRITVFHYDSLNGNIVQHFLGAIGIDSCTELGNIDNVNRSLTPVELSFMRGLNKCIGRHSRALSDYLIYLRPNIKTALKYDRLVVSLLERRFQNDIKWINRTFFGHDVVGLLTTFEQTESILPSYTSQQMQ